MNERLVIDCQELWDSGLLWVPDGLRAMQRWLRLNGINPADVPLDSEMVIEDSAFGMVIRYTAYLRNDLGRAYTDPDNPGVPASEDRTALLRVAPAPHWLTALKEDQ